MAWGTQKNTSSGGNVNLGIQAGYSNVSRSGNTVYATLHGRMGMGKNINNSTTWSTNEFGIWLPSGGTKYVAKAAKTQSTANKWYEKTRDCSWNVSASQTSLTAYVGFGWEDWDASEKVTASVDIPFPSGEYSFNMNILNPDGSEPYSTGEAGSVERSINGGTYERKYNEDANAYAHGTTFNYRNFSPGTGRHLASVSGVSPNNTTGPWSLTLTGNTTVEFRTAWNTYTISYNANGGTGAPGNQTKTYGTNLTLSSTRPTRANTTANGYVVTFNGNGGTPSKSTATATNTTSYTFNNWNTASGGGGTSYAPGATYSSNSGATLYAQWSSSTSRGGITTATANKSNTTSSRTVSLNANSGSCGTASLTSSATVTYTCNGWYTATSGGTKRANAGAAYTPTATETVYAQWTSSTGSYSAVTLPAATKANTTATATVTFNANGGSCSTTSLSSTATTTYSFDGWYTATSGGTRRGGTGGTYVPSASETLYAQYFSSIGTYGTIMLPTPTRTGYSFNGWATSSSATSGVFGAYVPTGNVTLYATWSAAEDAIMHYKENGAWTHGVTYYKENGAWTKARRIYVKENGVWIPAKNSSSHEELAQYTHAELAAYTHAHITRGCF